MKPYVPDIDSTQLWGPGGLRMGTLEWPRSRVRSLAGLFPSRRSVLWVSVGDVRSAHFMEVSDIRPGTLVSSKPSPCSKIICPQPRAPTSLTTHSKMVSGSPEGPFSPSVGVVRLWLSTSEPGGSCSSRGTHALLVDLRMPLLLLSWPPWGLSNSWDFSIIISRHTNFKQMQIRHSESAFGFGSGRGQKPGCSQSNEWIQVLEAGDAVSEERSWTSGYTQPRRKLKSTD